MTSVDEVREKHAKDLGIPQERIEVVRLDLSILNNMGTFVRVYAGGLTIFSSRATWRELGVPRESSRRLRYKRPPKLLVPPAIPKWFSNTASRARRTLEVHGTEVDFMHPYHWVDYKNWGNWLADFRKVQEEWNLYRQDKVIERYDALLQQLHIEFEGSAREAYQTLKEAGEPELPSENQFVTEVVASALARMPTPEEIEEKLVIRYFTPAILDPTDIERLQAQQEEARIQYQHQMELKALQHEAEVDERITQMQAERIERLRQQAQEMTDPLEQVSQRLIDEIEDTTQRVLDVVEEHGGLRGRAGESLRKLHQRTRILDDLGRGAILRLVGEAASLTQGNEEETDEENDARNIALEATLRQITRALEKKQEIARIVAEEIPQLRWRCICLNFDCRHVWIAEGSTAPIMCPHCASNNILTKEEEKVS